MIDILAFQFFSRELLVVAIAVLVLFGGTRLPQIGRLLGRSLKEFRKGLRSAKDEFQDATRDLDMDDDLEELDYDDQEDDDRGEVSGTRDDRDKTS